MHAGREGISLGIIKKFAKAFLDYQSDSVVAIIGPQIARTYYPNEQKTFIKGWWKQNQEFISKRNGVYYPDIANAAIAQLSESFENIEIIVSGLDTFSNLELASHRKAKMKGIEDTKPRNLFFIGYKT